MNAAGDRFEKVERNLTAVLHLRFLDKQRRFEQQLAGA
jgi:hypothetical protein